MTSIRPLHRPGRRRTALAVFHVAVHRPSHPSSLLLTDVLWSWLLGPGSWVVCWVGAGSVSGGGDHRGGGAPLHDRGAAVAARPGLPEQRRGLGDVGACARRDAAWPVSRVQSPPKCLVAAGSRRRLGRGRTDQARNRKNRGSLGGRPSKFDPIDCRERPAVECGVNRLRKAPGSSHVVGQVGGPLRGDRTRSGHQRVAVTSTFDPRPSWGAARRRADCCGRSPACASRPRPAGRRAVLRGTGRAR